MVTDGQLCPNHEKSVQKWKKKGGTIDAVGMVYEDSNNYPSAETAYRKSLGIKVQQDNKDSEVRVACHYFGTIWKWIRWRLSLSI